MSHDADHAFAFLQCHVQTCDRLAIDTKIFDLKLLDENNNEKVVTGVYNTPGVEGIDIFIPRSNITRHPLEGKVANQIPFQIATYKQTLAFRI
jgi:hypothetical protein